MIVMMPMIVTMLVMNQSYNDLNRGSDTRNDPNHDSTAYSNDHR